METCRAIGMGTHILTSKDIPANEADTLGEQFGELVECCDGCVELHQEHKFQMMSRKPSNIQVLESSWKRHMRAAVEAATDAAASKLAATGDRAQIYRWTSPSKDKGYAFLNFYVLVTGCVQLP